MVLTVVGLVMLTVRTLTPSRLTPLVEQVANRMLNAYVEVGSVELSFRSSYPFIDLDMSDISVISKDIANLPASQHDNLPVWADTLLTIEHLHGGINPFRLHQEIIDLHDLLIDGPQVNILIVDTVVNNFSIIPDSLLSGGGDSRITRLPDIRLNRFRLVSPRLIRYADMAQRTEITAEIVDASLTNDSSGERYLPEYHVDFGSEINSPLFGIIGQSRLKVAFDGIVEWRHNHPYQIELRDFDFSLFRLSGRLDTSIDFLDNMTVNKFDLRIHPLAINDILSFIPEDYARQKKIPRRLDTDATVTVSTKLLQPYTIGSVLLPHADVAVDIPDCYLNYDNMVIRQLALSLGVALRGSTPNEAVFDIHRLTLDGPHASLQASGRVTEIMDDPRIEGHVHGTADAAALPHSLISKAKANIKGSVTLDTRIQARASMFSAENFHKIRAKGDIGIENFYFQAYDTLSFYKLDKASLRFGANEGFRLSQVAKSDSLLRVMVDIDTAQMLVSGLNFKMGHIRLTAGADDYRTQADSTLCPPVRGRLKAGAFSMFTISDTLGVQIAGIDGNVTMLRPKNNARLPKLGLDIGLGQVSGGNNRMRLVFGEGKLNCDMALLPPSERPKLPEAKPGEKKPAAGPHAFMPVDSVIKFARAIRARHHSPYPRVHPVMTAGDTEVIDWGTSKMINRLLLDWKLKGTLHTGVGRVFTPVFPVRNRIKNLAVDFSNDTISLTDVAVKAGKSDFLVSGRISNVKHGLTSESGPSPLKINFELLSDTIDINEIAGAFFTGASSRGERLSASSGDKEWRAQLDKEMKEQPDSASPFLVPSNIDARFNITAKNINYSDMALRNFTGLVLMHDGALNIHDCKASSEAGSVVFDALYYAPTPDDMNFGFGMDLKDFNIRNFLKMMPPVDSLMPLMRDLSGVVSAQVAATTKLNPDMKIDLPSMKAAIRLEGSSLVFLSEEMYHKIGKWLRFKKEDENMVKHLDVEMLIDDGTLRLYPFIFDFNRYRLGIQGYTDVDLQLHYHVAVLKSIIPFKFGINVSGPYDHLKIRFGGAHFDEKTVEEHIPVVADMRLDLLNQIQEAFGNGVRNSKFAKVAISDNPIAGDIDLEIDTITAADSLYLIREGFIPQ